MKILNLLSLCLVMGGLSVAQGRVLEIKCKMTEGTLSTSQPFSNIESISLSDIQSYEQTRKIYAGYSDELIFTDVESKLSIAFADVSLPNVITKSNQATTLRSSAIGQKQLKSKTELITLTEGGTAYVARYVHTAKNLIRINNLNYQVSLAVSELRSPKNASLRGRTAQLILTDRNNSTVRADLNCDETLDGESLGVYAPYKTN